MGFNNFIFENTTLLVISIVGLFLCPLITVAITNFRSYFNDLKAKEVKIDV